MKKLRLLLRKLFCQHKNCELNLDQENCGISCNSIKCHQCGKVWRFSYDQTLENFYNIWFENE